MKTFATAEVCHDEVTSTDGRRHARAGVCRSDARIVPGGGDRPGAVLSSVAGSDHGRRDSGVYGASLTRPPAVVEHVQHRGVRAAVLLSHHVEARPHDVHDSLAAPVWEVADGPESRGSPAAADARHDAETPNDAHDLVCRGPAVERSPAPPGTPYR